MESRRSWGRQVAVPSASPLIPKETFTSPMTDQTRSRN
jgi:hypothetical protein